MNSHSNKLAIGTAQFGMPYGIANRNGQVQLDEISAILDLAWDRGIDTLDTAKSYGTSEESIGHCMKDRSNSSWKIITKLSGNCKNITEQIQDSFEKLTTLPTIVMAHSASLFMDNEFQEGLSNAREKQIISKIGVSLYNENEINQIMESSIKPEVIQLPLNILDTRLYRREVLTRLFEKDIEIHTRSTFLQGLFYLPQDDLKDHFVDAIPYLDKLKLIASETKLTLAELSLLWLVSLEEVSKVVIGVDNANQLNSHLKTLEKKVSPACFEEALLIHYENENILNPSNW